MALGWIALGAADRIDQDLGIILQLSDPVPHAERYVRALYFVNSGEMEILLRENQVVARVGPGSHVGEMSLLCSGKRNASVRAMTFCEVHRLSKTNFDTIRQRHPDFDAQIREEIARRANTDTP